MSDGEKKTPWGGGGIQSANNHSSHEHFQGTAASIWADQISEDQPGTETSMIGLEATLNPIPDRSWKISAQRGTTSLKSKTGTGGEVEPVEGRQHMVVQVPPPCSGHYKYNAHSLR